MKKYESSQKQILKNREQIYNQLSDLRNLEAYKDRMPQDKVKNLTFTEDCISMDVDPVGNVELKIIDREAPKVIKFAAGNIPVDLNLWIQLVSVDQEDTRMKVTIKADIPLMLRPMVGNKLDKAADQVADMIAQLLNAQ